MASDVQRNQGSPAKPGVDSHDPQNRDPNGIMEHVKVSTNISRGNRSKVIEWHVSRKDLSPNDG